MRKAAWMAAASFAAIVSVTGCGSDGGTPEKRPEAGASTAGAGKPAQAPAKGTLVQRATGSWKSIGTPGDDTLDTLTVADGKVTSRGAKLSCTGTLVPGGEKDGKETASLTLTCEGGKDGGRGLGHLTVKPDGSALVLDWDGPKGGWGGPVDSYRRA
ncbi:hypothetical protein M1P56_18850 [Streptomyces sp. HU2014]|uniref:hypothetical protein n=1 Tax=Streptomyces sp. HU2014 TaxID=2939414 RepID=UPI00200FA61A|nr:hypothetical protein [Streptomyces sp. HU2014]UQI46252.1 hypothetical protein M1P56_18850 [Streptomyces sp. HU2014]